MLYYLDFGKGLRTLAITRKQWYSRNIMIYDPVISTTSPSVDTLTPEVITPLLKAPHPFLRLMFSRIIDFSLRFNINGMLSRPRGDCHIAAIDAV